MHICPSGGIGRPSGLKIRRLMRTGSTPVTRTKGTFMSDEYLNPYLEHIQDDHWFCYDFSTAVASPLDGVWVLQDFLTAPAYQAVKHDIRIKPVQWHNNYGGRHLSENGNYPVVTNLGARLIPYLNHLLGVDVRLTTVRAYVDFSGSYFYPHLDSKAFAVNVQIYMTDLDYPELGTQFCINPVMNAESELLSAGEIRARSYREEDFFTVPFRQNWGYINDNRQRKIHKTLPVPLGTIRESIHFNYVQKIYSENPAPLGLELPWFNNEKWYKQFVTTINQHYDQTHN